MRKKIFHEKWYYIILGLPILYLALFIKNSSIEPVEKVQISAILSKDIVNVKGSRSRIDYKFWVKGCENQFNILNGSISSGKHQSFKKLKKGKSIIITISATDSKKVGNNESHIIVRAIKLNGQDLLSLTEFEENRSLYERRSTVFLTFIGFIFLLNGIFPVSGKINYWIIGIFIAAIVVMRIFEFGIY